MAEESTSTATAPEVIYDSANRAPAVWEELSEVVQRRGLVGRLIQRDLKARYKRSVLGALWSMLSPLLMMAVFTAVFASNFRKGAPDYAVFVLTGLLIWRFFAQSSTGCMTRLAGGGALLSQIHMPRTTVALSVVGAGLVNLLLSMIPLFVVMVVVGVPIGVSALAAPVGMLFATMFSLGIGLFLSIFALRFRDVIEFWQAITFAWYFLTPVMYPLEILPEPVRAWIVLNPMHHIVEVFRAPICDGVLPATETFALAAAWSIGALVLGWTFFCGRADEVAYRV